MSSSRGNEIEPSDSRFLIHPRSKKFMTCKQSKLVLIIIWSCKQSKLVLIIIWSWRS
jgi:hypothetical protein